MQLKKDQIYETLRSSILDGTLPPGSRLLPEIQLAKELNVGQVTLRSALARLEAEHLVERIRSLGTFVSDSVQRNAFLLILPDGAENLETPSRYIAAGIDEAARKNSVIIERCPESLFLAFSAKERREMILRHSISGVLVETGHRRISSALIAAVRELELPVVVPHGASGDAGDSGFLILRTDEASAFMRAYEYMANKGHRNVASLFVRLPGETEGYMRGFSLPELRKTIREIGLNDSSDLIAYLPNDVTGFRKQLEFWLDSADVPTAIICHSDRVAMHVFALLREMGVAIPTQISLMGYSNFPGSQLLNPALTTVDTCLKICAEMALYQLMNSSRWYKKDGAAQEIFTPFVLIERNSIVSR